MKENLEKKFQELEKRIAALEGPVQAQPKKFVPEDSNGVCKNLIPCCDTKQK